MTLQYPITCTGKVRCLDLGAEALIRISLFLDNEEEILGDVPKETLPKELHHIGAIFTYEATDKDTARFTPVPPKPITDADVAQMEKESQALFAGDC